MKPALANESHLCTAGQLTGYTYIILVWLPWECAAGSWTDWCSINSL